VHFPARQRILHFRVHFRSPGRTLRALLEQTEGEARRKRVLEGLEE